jgi:hypothetical protein
MMAVIKAGGENQLWLSEPNLISLSAYIFFFPQNFILDDILENNLWF